MPWHGPPAANRLWKFSLTFSDRELSFLVLNNMSFFVLSLLRTNQIFIVKHTKFAKFSPFCAYNAHVSTKLTSVTMTKLLAITAVSVDYWV